MSDEPKKVPKFVPQPGQVDYSNARWAPVVNSVVHHDGKILLVKRNANMRLYPGYWNGISGFLDDDRNLREKVTDEIVEELGVTEEDVGDIKLCEIFHQEAPEYKKTWIVHAVLAELKTKDVTLDWEAEKYVWVDPGRVEEYTLLPRFIDVVKAALPYLP